MRVTADCGANSMKRSRVASIYWGLTAGAVLKLPNTLLKSPNFHHPILCRRRKKRRVGAFQGCRRHPRVGSVSEMAITMKSRGGRLSSAGFQTRIPRLHRLMSDACRGPSADY